MKIITALKDTWLKKDPTAQASSLPENQKVFVPQGKTYGVENFKVASGGHYLVELASGAGKWYIYDPQDEGHWDTYWESRENDSAHTPENPLRDYDSNLTIDWSNNSQQISRYFNVGEVTKGQADRRPVNGSSEEKNILALAQQLDLIRESWGSSILVTSWYRPPTVNRRIGGASRSQHIYGRAADIKPVSGSLFNFQSWLDKYWYGALGYGARRGFVHIDTRNNKGWKSGGSKGARWNY